MPSEKKNRNIIKLYWGEKKKKPPKEINEAESLVVRNALTLERSSFRSKLVCI